MKSVFRAFFFLLFWSVWANAITAQPGCPDPQANNFNASATSNDGSCQYPATTYTPVFKANLPSDLLEISGLTLGNGKWWGHNDSGFDETFFHVNPETGNVLQSVKLKNGHNRDWEDIAADAEQIYVGDFGNNDNDRQNLGVYLVPFSQIGNSNSETVQESEWQFLPFSYEDQTDFTTQPQDSTVFDCEAMLVFEGKIHLFTKSRKHYNTVHYTVNSANHLAEKIEAFNTEGLITGASLSPDGKLIALVGYDLRPFIPTVFCWLLWDWPAGTDQFFAGNKRRIELGTALQIGQVESIGFDNKRSAYISNEVTKFNGITIVAQSVRKLNFSAWVPEFVGTAEPGTASGALAVFPNPFSNRIQLQYKGDKKPDSLFVKNQLGQTVLSLDKLPETLNLGFLPKGIYVFETWREGRLLNTVKGLKE